MINIMMMTMIR